MKQGWFLVLMVSLYVSLSAMAHAEEFSSAELNFLAATYGRNADECAKSSVPVYETTRPFNTSLVLEAESREGVKEVHLVARGKLPEKTRIGRNEKTGEILFTCIGGFKIEGPQFIPPVKKSPPRIASPKKVDVIPPEALRKVELSGSLNLSGDFRVQHDISPGFKQSLDALAEELRGDGRTRATFRTRRKSCWGFSTAETTIGGATAGFGAASFNNDAKAGPKILSAALLLGGLVLAGDGFYRGSNLVECEAAGFVIGVVGGALAGSNNRARDKSEDFSVSQPSNSQPGGIPPPAPPSFDPPN